MAVEPKLETIGNALIDIRDTINGLDNTLGRGVITTLGNDIRTLNSRKGIWKWVKKRVVVDTETNSDFSSDDYVTTTFSRYVTTSQLVINLEEYTDWTITINVTQSYAYTCYYKLSSSEEADSNSTYIINGERSLSGSNDVMYINAYYRFNSYVNPVPFNTLMNDVQIQITATKNIYGNGYFLEKDICTNTISANAYKDDLNLIAIVIPSSVVNIGNNAFEGCDNLQFLYCDGSPTLGTSVFDRTDYVFNNLITT